MEVLRLLHQRGPMRGHELAAELGVARSTAHRLLISMRAQGFVEKAPTGHDYALGPTLRAIAASSTRRNLGPTVQDHLEELAGTTGETATFMVLEGNGVRFAAGSESPNLVRVASRVGILLPAHATSGGKSLLAELTDVQIRDLYPRGVAPLTARTVNTIDGLLEELAVVRERGYATNVAESANEVGGVAMVVRGPNRKALGALCLAAPLERMPESRLSGVLGRLRHVAGSLEAALNAS